MANKYVTANNKLVVVDGKLLQVSGDNVDDELLNLIDTQTTSLGTTELSVSELDTLIDNHIVDGVTLDSSALLIDSPSNNSVEIKDIRVSNIDVAFITLNTTNGHIDLYGSGNDVTLYQDTTLTYESGNITTDNLTAENIKKDVNILGVVGTHEGGASLNLAYGTTPPTDTSKIWLQCAEPSGVEVQNYIGECAVSNVANWGGIENPVAEHSKFYCGYYNIGYIGNNQIAIVGYNHIRIYDLTSKSYIADYTISVGTNNVYTNVICKDNVLYFGYETYLYKYDLTTQTISSLSVGSSRYIKYIFFSNENEIDIFAYFSSNSWSYRYRYNINTNSKTQIIQLASSQFDKIFTSNSFPIVKIGNYVYNLNYNYGVWKYDLLNNTIINITTMADFVTNTLGGSSYTGYYAIGDNERYIYLVGGLTNGTNSFKQIVRYDTINDSFELLEKTLLYGKYRHFVMLIDNRVYIFGGGASTTNNNYGRSNQIDYFDLSYPLTQNNAIITTNTVNTDNLLPLINTEKLKLNSNISSAYLGNADNLAEKVNAYYWNGTKWVGINCDDYREE